jgi:hypothetical protein
MIWDNRWVRGLCALALLGMSQFALAQTGAGTYTGTYYGGDTGTVSIVVDQNGGVTCNFVSATTGTNYSGTGSVYTTSPFYINCSSAASASNFLSASASGTAGGTISGNLAAQAASSTSFQGNFTASYTAPGNINLQSLTGLWYDQSYTGSGFNLLGSSAGLAVTFYGFASNGNLLWLTGVGPTSITVGTTVSIKMATNSGGTFTKPVNNSANSPWGTLQLTFSSCTAASAVLTGTDGTVTEALVPLVVVQGAPGC